LKSLTHLAAFGSALNRDFSAVPLRLTRTSILRAAPCTPAP
jgi:hypothetical protein